MTGPKIPVLGDGERFRQPATAGARPRSDSDSGSSTRTVVPTSTALSSSIRPPCRSTIVLAIARPRPVPGIAFSEARELRKKRSNSCVLLVLGEAERRCRSTSITATPSTAVSRDLDASAGRRELERVRDEVVEHLREPRGIALQRHGQALRARRQLDLLGRGRRLRGLDALGHERLELDRPQLEGELARVDLRQEEQVADEVEQPRGVPVDDPEVAQLLLVEPAVVAQQLDVAADRGQRRAQLVRDERDELVLQPVELAQPVVLRREQLLGRLGLGAGRALGDEQKPRSSASSRRRRLRASSCRVTRCRIGKSEM